MREPLARLRVVQAQFPVHRAAYIGFAPLWVPDQRATLDAQRERAAVGLALASLLRLEAMQLAVMPAERAEADQPCSIWLRLASHGAVGEYPGIDTVRFPDLCQLLARLLESQPLAQCFGLVALFGLDRCQLAEFPVEPVLAHFERRKGLIPALFATGPGLDVLDHEDAHREELAEPDCQAQFPVPTGPGGRRQLLAVLLAVLARLAARGLARATSVAHAGAVLLRFLDAISRLCLDIEVGVGGGGHHDALAFGTRIDAHRDGLLLARGWLDIEAHAEHAPFPEAGGFPTSDPAPCPRGGRGHQWGAFLIDHRDTDVRHVR